MQLVACFRHPTILKNSFLWKYVLISDIRIQYHDLPRCWRGAQGRRWKEFNCIPILNAIGVFSSEGIFSCEMETDLTSEWTAARTNADRWWCVYWPTSKWEGQRQYKEISIKSSWFNLEHSFYFYCLFFVLLCARVPLLLLNNNNGK